MRKIQLSIFIIILATSCKKVFDVKPDDFNVTLLNTSLKAGDTARFEIEGNPDFITFYSGEKGNNYEYRNRTVADSSIPQLNFTSFGQNLSALHPSSLSLLVSTDYKEDTTTINNSTWTNITNRATLSTGSTNTASGIINLADFRSFDSIYFAFKYNTSAGVSAVQPTWTIQSFTLSNLSFPDSLVHSINTIANTGWQIVDIATTDKRWVASSTQISISGAPTLSAANNDWAITKLFLKRVNPDKGVPIKQIIERVGFYSYRFTKSGNYTVAFLATNSKNGNNSYEIVKKINVVVN